MEKWFGDHIAAYIVLLGLKSFKIGFNIGTENCIYLGFVCFGVDFYL